MKNIYLAGPDVFRKNAKEYGKNLKELCSTHGYVGLFPLDNEIHCNDKVELSKLIKKANIDMIKKADFVIANLSPFRGVEPDSGTVWEVGFAQGLGKKVIGYSNDTREMTVRVKENQLLSQDAVFDLNGLVIEDFGLSHNLMFSDIIMATCFEDCFDFLT